MGYSSALGLLLLATAFAVKTPPTEEFYRAAVVEYHPKEGRNGSETLQLNVAEYQKLITEAAKSADIVVFPEAALIHGDMTIFLKVPSPSDAVVPADDTNSHTALKQLSKSARENGIYVAVNLHEEDNDGNSTVKYNTDVVFDRNGTIIARYRKYNLFSEVKHLNTTKSAERVKFDTDFGVQFGIFTCFDILFEDPALILREQNVTDFLFLTWWFSELPFLTAVQEQAAWSYSTDSNFLAAGGNLVDVGSSGSGIYAGRNGPIIYTQSTSNETKLLTAKVLKKNKNGTVKATDPEFNMTRFSDPQRGRLKMKTEELQYYTTLSLSPSIDSLKVVNYSIWEANKIFASEICQSSICCRFSINMTFIYKNQGLLNESEITNKDDGFHHYMYRAVVFDGVRSFDGYATGGVQVCGVISCLNNSLESCGRPTLDVPLAVLTSPDHGPLTLVQTRFESLHLEISSLNNRSHVQPSILEAGEEPDNYGSLPSLFSFYSNETNAELNITSSRLGTAAIYSRVFSRDGQSVTTSSASILHLNTFIALISLIVTFVLLPS